MNFIIQLVRIAVGGLFIFSGLIKLNDPVGFSIKLTEYFQVFGTEFMIPLALFLAVFICIFEVVLGITLLIGLWRELTMWGLLLMIVFFTFLTFYSAYYNKVTDCGCFGDAIPLTPWESFTKDVILSILIGFLFIFRRRIHLILPKSPAIIITSLLILAQVVFANHVINHLPLIDFRAYKVGTDIERGMMTAEELGLEGPVFEIYYVLKNKNTGEEKRMTSTTYIDEKWWEKKEWEMLSDRTENVQVKEGYEPPIHDFVIYSEDEDITSEILDAEKVLFIIAYQVSGADREAFDDINELVAEAEANGIRVLGLSASTDSEIAPFRHEVQAAFPFAFMDETTLKTIVRSNPGIVYLENGVIIGKWHYNDTPDLDELHDQHP